jgi:hypothetical protein
MSHAESPPIPLPCDLSAQLVVAGERSELVCPKCDQPMAAYQPNEDDTDWLLGVCDPCRTWWAIYHATNAPNATFIRFPLDQLQRMANARFHALARGPKRPHVMEPPPAGAQASTPAPAAEPHHETPPPGR